MKEDREKHRQPNVPAEGNAQQWRNYNDDVEKGSHESSSNASDDTTPIYLTPDSTLQTPEEDRKDKSNDPRKDNTISVSNDDLHEIKAGRLTGREPREDGREDEGMRK